MVGQPLKHLYHGAARFAGLHHVQVHIRKRMRMERHRVGKCFALAHIAEQRLAHLRRDAFALQIRHAAERAGERHAGIEEVGQLTGEVGEILQAWLGGAALEQPPRYPDRPGSSSRFLAFERFHRNRKEPQRADLRQSRRTIRRFQHARDHFASVVAGSIIEICHYSAAFTSSAGTALRLPRRYPRASTSTTL